MTSVLTMASRSSKIVMNQVLAFAGGFVAEMVVPCTLLVAMGLFFFAAGALAFREA